MGRLGRPQGGGRSDCIEADCGNKPRIGSIIAWHWESWEGTWQGGRDDGPCHPDKTSSRALPGQLRHNVIINMATASLLAAHDAVPLTQKGGDPKKGAAPLVEIGDK